MCNGSRHRHPPLAKGLCPLSRQAAMALTYSIFHTEEFLTCDWPGHGVPHLVLAITRREGQGPVTPVARCVWLLSTYGEGLGQAGLRVRAEPEFSQPLQMLRRRLLY